MRFHPSVGAVFEQVTENTYELVMQRDDSLQQVSFGIRGQEGLEQYRSNDLFQCHPTVPDAWCWRGRADDIIVFLNGEKTNPVSMEQHIVAQNPEVASAVVIGTQRFQAALLIEPAASYGNQSLNTVQQAEFIERIWPSVQEANKSAPAYARVEKALILILPAERPLIRAGKGTIQRAASIAQYAAEIDALYERADVIDGDHDNGLGATAAPINLADPESVSRFIRESVDSATDWSNSATKPETDQTFNDSTTTFFDRGMDSLMALQLVRTLRRGLHRPELALSTIYSNPTVSQLQAAIASYQDPSKDSDALLMESLLKTYSELIQQIPKPTSLPAGHGANVGPVTVLLTGSTGTVGTFLLRALLDRSDIKHVICLNRGQDGGYKAQKARLAAAGLEITDSVLDQRVTFLHADLRQPLLGLDRATYKDLRTRTGLVIHNAWPVNFNLGLSAFEPHLAGLVNLFHLAAGTTLGHPARFVFISSVGAVGGLAAEGRPVPEKVFTSFNTPFSNGYARSKFLSELLCDSAARNLGTSTMIVRVGQVAGAVRQPGGEWNRVEWLPSLVLGSRDLGTGCLPDSIGPQFSEIDWIPSDILADVLTDLAISPYDEDATNLEMDGAQVFNLRNPHTTTWDALLPTIVDAFQKRLRAGQAPEVVTPSTWLAQLSDSERKAMGGSAMPSNPALKLVDFYRNGLWGTGSGKIRQKSLPMEIEHSLAKSAALRDMQAVNPDWMKKWVDQWMAADDTNKSG